jgi:Uma2 family endonuclease
MGMSATQLRPGTPTSAWTADEVWAYYERQPTVWPRYELVDGELLVSPSPRIAHHRIHQELVERIYGYVRAQQIGEMFWSPADLRVALGTVVQPDLFVVAWPAQARRAREWSQFTRVLLTVEILSPSTARYDRLVKRRFYARMGVPEYWIVDPDTRLVERCLPDGRSEVLGDALVWHPEGAREPLTADLPAFFTAALGAGGEEDGAADAPG